MKKLIAIFLLVTLSACQTTQGNQKQTIGTLLGAGLGGWAGSNVGKGKGKLIGVAVGVLGGAWLGNNIGKSLDNADRAAMAQSSQTALEQAPTNRSVKWSNPNSGNYGYTTPKKTYQTAAGQYCREYQQTVVIASKTQSAYGTACRQSDGSWKIQ